MLVHCPKITVLVVSMIHEYTGAGLAPVREVIYD